MNDFRKLKVWQKAVNLATIIYQLTNKFPREELYGLVSQMRRCAVSISSNIAEGSGRSSYKEFTQFLNIATGSCYELETQLLICKNLNYLNDDDYSSVNQSVVEIQKMLFSLRKSISGSP